MRLDDLPKCPEYYETCDLRRNSPQWFPAYFDYIPPSTCFDPGTIAIATLATTAISTGVGVMGAMQQASATAEAARYQSQVAKNDQQIAKDNAAYARQAGQEEAFRESQKTAAIIGATEAGQGASGIDVASGSPANVVKSERQVGRLDVMNILQQAELRGRGYNITASNQGAEAGLQSMKASSAQTAGTLTALGRLAEGGASLGSKWTEYTKPGGVFR